jgi:hypothetical protein
MAASTTPETAELKVKRALITPWYIRHRQRDRTVDGNE